MSSASRDTLVLLVHGQRDTTIPAAASALAAAQLGAAGFKVALKVEPGVGHTISSSGAEKALAFLKQTLAQL
ncbi:prolyl oligopeptidase family serine peptidase [Rhizobium laguerreae]|uniref:prolyl oligopeptidase family serine peptidase n=1 Tax=Rhizobium laguerreae TaxID=1076926 RepID=UPI001C910B30|nr:prolyl oligopeptidase family serine peptidase [Rhizobium laguerreae]